MSLVRNFLNERRKRAIATILRYCEANVYRHLSPEQQVELRAKVIAAVGEYHESAVDVVKASTVETDMVINEELVLAIDRIDRYVRTHDG